MRLGLGGVFRVRVCQRRGLMLPSDGVSMSDRDGPVHIPLHDTIVGIVSFVLDSVVR
jgi:hypothetical protein